MDVLERAEALDSYRTSCIKSFLNNAARESQGYSLSSVSDAALKSLQDATNLVPLLDNCEIAIINANADNGFPHTRPPNIVCIPDSMCSESKASNKFVETLIHEAIHVHQRYNKNMWADALKRVKWTPVTPDRIPDTYKERLRLNPDTILEQFWSWSDHHVPLPMFRNTRSPSLGDVNVEWMDLRTGALFHVPPKGFLEAYPQQIHQMEHPYEIYAEIFAAKGIKTEESLKSALNDL
jgi:hypothetical protein